MTQLPGVKLENSIHLQMSSILTVFTGFDLLKPKRLPDVVSKRVLAVCKLSILDLYY